jgi:hypothetical protein
MPVSRQAVVKHLAVLDAAGLRNLTRFASTVVTGSGAATTVLPERCEKWSDGLCYAGSGTAWTVAGDDSSTTGGSRKLVPQATAMVTTERIRPVITVAEAL